MKLADGPRGNLTSDYHKHFRELEETKDQGGKANLGKITTGSWEKTIGETTIATSVLLVWGQQPCLLERLSFLGPGAKAACERQTLALRTYRLAH